MSLKSVDVIIRCEEVGKIYREKGTYSTPGSAGVDLYAVIDDTLILSPGECKLVDTGINVYVKDPDYAAVILPRSGKGFKEGIVIGNLVGLIDSDYQGNLMMAVWNRNLDKDVKIEPMDKLCQLVFIRVAQPEFNIVEDFEAESDRGAGGFGSTGG